MPNLFSNQPVPIKPGHTVLTLISGPRAFANDNVIVFKAPLDAAYAIDDPIPVFPAMDEIFTTEPNPFFFINGSTALII